ncbi:MFS general substrate transporter [Biscogniauxia sp. FL1348]|nr:MFS general substrate transporter [Biscogniauxia sp. FL1348]
MASTQSTGNVVNSTTTDSLDKEKCQPDLSHESTPSGSVLENLTDSDVEAQSSQPTKKPFSFWMSIICILTIAFIVSWDATCLAVAIPSISKDLNGSSFQSFWASIAFMIGVVATQPIYTSVSDIVGRKPPLYTAMTLFAVGAIIFATANDMSVVIAGRLVQGLGGGGLDVLESVLLADVTTLKERPLYLSLQGIPIVSGFVLGPIIGSLFSEFATWRWIGWINLPFTGFSMVLAFFFLHLRPIEVDTRSKLQRLDWTGMVLFVVGAAAFSLPLSWADSLYPWTDWRTLLPFIIGVIVMIGFWFYEARPQEPMIPHRLFHNITACMSIATGFLHGLVMYSILLYLPLFFQAVYLQSPLQSGISILPVCVLMIAASAVAPILVKISKMYLPYLWGGWILTTLFMGLFYLAGQDSSTATANAFQSLLGVGIGIVFTVTALPMQGSVKNVDDQGLAAGMLVTFRLYGALIGLAIGSSVFNSFFAKSIVALDPLPEPLAELADPSHAISFIPNIPSLDLPQDQMEALIQAYRVPFRAIWVTMAALSGIATIMSFLMTKIDHDNEEQGKQRFEERKK